MLHEVVVKEFQISDFKVCEATNICLPELNRRPPQFRNCVLLKVIVL